MTFSPNHCTAERKCWEHYQGWTARAMQRDVELAAALVRFRSLAIHDIADVQRVEEACHALSSILGRRWREMTRQPFDFPKPETTPPRKSVMSIDDLLS